MIPDREPFLNETYIDNFPTCAPVDNLYILVYNNGLQKKTGKLY